MDCCCNKMTVDFDKFKAWFPELNADRDMMQSAYAGAESFISTRLGTIVLDKEMQIRGVYLATAHNLYLRQNPQVVSQGKVASATEGSVSASWTQPAYKSWTDYMLSLTPYGLELLTILARVQPPMPRRPYAQYPYYRGDYGQR